MSLAAVAIGSMIVGGITSAVGKADAADAQYQSSMYQAQVSQRNKQQADAAATNAIATGSIQEANSRRQTAQLEGTQRATLAGLGQVLGVGTAGKILGDTAQLGEADALNIRRNAQRDALGFTIQGMDYKTQAQMQTAQANNALDAGNIGVFGSVVSTVGSVASTYSSFKGGALSTGSSPALVQGSYLGQGGVSNPLLGRYK